jgi:xanthine dehydrogenase molybdopterin-binding subunit B
MRTVESQFCVCEDSGLCARMRLPGILAEAFRGQMTILRSVGTSQERIDAFAKVRGEHRFPSDHALPGMLWLRVVRATRPHARLRSIDVSHARRVQGVACVLTAADIPGQNRYGLIVPDQPILCDERVRYVGEPLAIVAADSDEIARKAQILVKAEYEELPLVDDPLVAEKAAAIGYFDLEPMRRLRDCGCGSGR